MTDVGTLWEAVHKAMVLYSLPRVDAQQQRGIGTGTDKSPNQIIGAAGTPKARHRRARVGHRRGTDACRPGAQEDAACQGVVLRD